MQAYSGIDILTVGYSRLFSMFSQSSFGRIGRKVLLVGPREGFSILVAGIFSLNRLSFQYHASNIDFVCMYFNIIVYWYLVGLPIGINFSPCTYVFVLTFSYKHYIFLSCEMWLDF